MRVVQPWDRAKRGGGISTVGHVQNLAGQGPDQSDPALKSAELGEGSWSKDIQMCFPT